MEKTVCDMCTETIREGVLRDNPLFTLDYNKGKGIYPDRSGTWHFCTPECLMVWLKEGRDLFDPTKK